MNIVKLQDIKSTYRNPLHSYTRIMRKQKKKLRQDLNQSVLLWKLQACHCLHPKRRNLTELGECYILSSHSYHMVNTYWHSKISLSKCNNVEQLSLLDSYLHDSYLSSSTADHKLKAQFTHMLVCFACSDSNDPYSNLAERAIKSQTCKQGG